MAIGDDAAAAGMAVVDGATTEARTIDTEINRTRDYIATGAGAVAAATANKVVKRDANGRASFANPTAAGHAATKAYVDAQAPGPGSITSTQIADGTILYVDLHPDLQSRVRYNTWNIPLSAPSAAFDGHMQSGSATVQNDAVVRGNVYVPNSSPATSGYTVAYINSDGRLSRGASSERYKKYLSEIDPASLGDIWPNLTRYQMRQGDGAWKYGYIAERLAEHPDLEPFVVYAAHGGESVPDSIDFIALLIAQNAQLNQRVKALEERT
ncbi:hypothetical protein [Microbacterium paludicola]|uniref:hypothetical protein n=1 Tax=Microbacterium paludicola TaxID=300019 RepID=UPI0011A9FF84|nr:hypothetical protein [Microbacterium paludicola]